MIVISARKNIVNSFMYDDQIDRRIGQLSIFLEVICLIVTKQTTTKSNKIHMTKITASSLAFAAR
jgi:hypothetical protein